MALAAEMKQSGTKANALAKPDLLSVEDAKALSTERVAELFKAHLNPGQLHFMKLLGFHKVIVDRAEGMHYVTRDGRKILDFFGGLGSLGFGPHQPPLLSARPKIQEG